MKVTRMTISIGVFRGHCLELESLFHRQIRLSCHPYASLTIIKTVEDFPANDQVEVFSLFSLRRRCCFDQSELVFSTGIEPVSETSYHCGFCHRVIVCGLDYFSALGRRAFGLVPPTGIEPVSSA